MGRSSTPHNLAFSWSIFYFLTFIIGASPKNGFFKDGNACLGILVAEGGELSGGVSGDLGYPQT